MIIVSACLAGVECRYNGSACSVPQIVDMVIQGKAIPICPEILAGLPTPRPPVEQIKGKIISLNGDDQTDPYTAGAQMGLEIAVVSKCKKAVLKSKSPTCGSGRIYDGTFSGTIVSGDGIFAKMLKEKGIEVCTEEIYS
ncbi:Uncharacterized conserved protein YbbK, DUF523 family [Pelosinus propionicus DSM 13327]|uniref:Uncharacterized conserved protein YbbK, DUF523 family n=2 Tax=Pelosinus TaxID=365348 RepID=A0A1I4MHA8_9FIRM|nr:Uncharacterized conserved protein YbbK, DUF523 family [Pelosinus propionicus DSM 13327]